MPVLGHDARVLPLKLVPVPGHGAQITTWAATKGYVQTGSPAWEPGRGTKSELGLNLAVIFSSDFELPLWVAKRFSLQFYSSKDQSCQI